MTAIENEKIDKCIILLEEEMKDMKIIDRGYLYQGKIYYGGKPKIFGPPDYKAYWPQPLDTPKIVSDWSDGPIDFYLQHRLAMPYFKFVDIDD